MTGRTDRPTRSLIEMRSHILKMEEKRKESHDEDGSGKKLGTIYEYMQILK